jgi:Hint module
MMVVPSNWQKIATVINCSFVTAYSGSSVLVNNSQLIVEGFETSIVNTTGNEPPFEILSSQMNISHVDFAGNTTSQYHAVVLLFNSTIEVYDVRFLNLTNEQPYNHLSYNDCHVYVAVDADNYENMSSCMIFDDSNHSFSIIDLSDECLSLSPTPVICFSGANTVEVKDVGPIPIHLLHVGDMVQSSEKTFTQIYGFGHLDPNQVGTFLRISFENKDDSDLDQSTSFIELSLQHLLTIERTNGESYHIAAGNVVVGDSLWNNCSVQLIQHVVRHGVYAPLTQSGDIMVGGVVASNYVELWNVSYLRWDQHAIIHTMFGLQRLFCKYNIDTCKKEMYINGHGIVANGLVNGSSIIQ